MSVRTASKRVQSVRETRESSARASAEYEVEIKELNQAEMEQLDEELSRQIRRYVPAIEGLHLKVYGSEALSQEASLSIHARRRLTADAASVARDFGEVRDRIEASGKRPGRYEAQFGFVIAEPASGLGAVTPTVLPDNSLEKKAIRGARLVRKDVDKFSEGARGVFVIEENRLATPLMLGEAIRRDAEADPDGFRNCRFVVIAETVRPSGWDVDARVGYIVPILNHQLTDEDVSLALHVAGSHGVPALRGRPAHPGELGVVVDTSRPRVTSRHLATVEVPASGGAATIEISGEKVVARSGRS